MAGEAGRPALAMRGLVKDFAGVRALDRANFAVGRGTIHGLVGQNGAGKSTLIKVLAGIHRPDAGTIEVDGRTIEPMTPQRAEQLGVHFIHQDRLLIPTFTVGEALFLGRELKVGPFLARRAMQSRARALLRDYFDLELPHGALVGELTTAQQQLVQITRALLHKPAMLVFDEPTAALVRREVDHLFAIIRRLRDQGLTIIYISHYLQEIEELCERVTVMRNGADVGTVDPSRTPAREIAAMMVARDLGEMFPKRAVPIGEPVLMVAGLRRRDSFADVSFSVRRGEVVGLTGLLGSGAKELVRCLFGLERIDGGQIRVASATAPARLVSPAAAVGRGLALVPDDRRGHGVALGMSVRENVTMASLDQVARFGLLRRRTEKRLVDRLIGELAIRTPGREAMVRNLSGGNQQKVVLAKWLSRRSDLYILDEPTVGVDVGAKVEIYRLIGALLERGAAVLLLSSDLDELVGLCDRVHVMYRGRITMTFAAGEATSDALLAAATTGSEEALERPAARH